MTDGCNEGGRASGGQTAQAVIRRDFLALASGVAVTAALGGGGVGGSRAAAEEVPKKPQPGAPGTNDIKLPGGAVMPTRRLGRTGVRVSALGLGGFHIGLPEDEKTSVRIIRSAVDHGVTFMDNCWDYNDGKSHERGSRCRASC